MKKFKIYAEKTENIEVDVECDNATDAAQTFKQLHPDFKIDYINDDEVTGFCETSGEVILQGDYYSVDEDGIYVLNKNL